MFQTEMNFWISEGQPINDIANMAEFCRERFQKLSPGRNIVKQVSQLDRRPGCSGCDLGRGFVSPVNAQSVCRIITRLPGSDLKPRNRSDARQRLATKPQRRDPKEIL